MNHFKNTLHHPGQAREAIKVQVISNHLRIRNNLKLIEIET